MKNIKPIYVIILILTQYIYCKTFSNITGINKKTCLVLSVGGPKGIAHLGAIDAIKEKDVKIDCIFGNSMGAVIGGLYAFNPNKDITRQYQELLGAYIYKTKSEKTLSALILGGLSLFLTGGTIGWETIVTGFIASNFIKNFSNRRFREVLNEYLNNINIEKTQIPFGTSYFMKINNELILNTPREGNLAFHVSKSANNPYIFEDYDLRYVDPGLDRTSTIPVEQACELFKPTKIIAINVSENEPVWSNKMNCPVKVINIKIKQDVSVENAIKGAGNEFEYLYNLGYISTLNNL